MNNFLDYKSFISGVGASWSAIMVGQPLDIIKVRMQNTGNSTTSTVLALVRQEGILAFWKASLPIMAGSTLTSSIALGTNENTKRFFKDPKNPEKSLKIWQHSVCGTASGFVRTFVICPFEHIVVKMQMQGKIDTRGDPIYKNSADCFKYIVNNYGVKGLYRGLKLSFFRDTFGNTVFFGAYQGIAKKVFGGDQIDAHQLNMWQCMMCGGTAGVIYWIFIFWLDIIKSKIQADSFTNPRYKSGKECWEMTVKQVGYSGMTRGLVPALLRAFPANAAYIGGFEMMMKILGREKY